MSVRGGEMNQTPQSATITIQTVDSIVRDWLDRYARHLVGTKQEQELINAIKGNKEISNEN